MSMESLLQALKKETINPSGDASRACVKIPGHFSTEVKCISPYRPVPISQARERPVQLCLHQWQHHWNGHVPWPTVPLEVFEPGVLWNMNPGKAAGPDKMPAKILKKLANYLSPAITTLPNKSLKAGVFPSTWKDTWMTPIFKKETHNDPANYRPASLISIICKVAETAICSHVRDHLDQHQILPDVPTMGSARDTLPQPNSCWQITTFSRFLDCPGNYRHL